MRCALTPDQEEIRRTARDLLASRAPMSAVRTAATARTFDADLWRTMRELGWPGIAVADDLGGGGLGAVELVVLLEELGYAATASPMLGTVGAALAIEAAGNAAQRDHWLPLLARGEALGAFGTGDGLVADGDVADVFVLVDGDQARLLERSRAAVTVVLTIDRTRGYARVTGLGEPLPGDAEAATDRVTLAVCADLAGVSRRALDMSVSYAKDRWQFGQPIGAFQAVAHRCAEMLLRTTAAQTLTRGAAQTVDADAPGAPEATAMAAAAAAVAGPDVTASAIQVHGGIGYTWEADVHWLYKRAQVDAQLVGGAACQQARVARCAATRLATVRHGL